MEDLTGLQVKSWEVVNYSKKGMWECKCTVCGNTEQFRAYHLKEGRVKECTHGKGSHTFKIDLTNKVFGELKVIKFNSVTGQWICECSCGELVEFTTYELNKRGVKSCGHLTNKFIDRTNQVFGELTVRKYLGNRVWECECSCGKMVKVNTGDLTSGNTKSCGHMRGKAKIIDLRGKQIGNWKVLEYINKSYWRCECSCGNIREVHSYSLRNEKSIKCNSGIHKYKNITNQQFGELIAKRYLGDGVWECECSCGNITNILGCNLRNNSTHSCGCKTLEFMQETLKDKYGDIVPSKLDNPRTQMQIEILHSKFYFEQLLLNFKIKCDRQPSLEEIGEILGVHRVTIAKYLEDYNLKHMVRIGYNVSSYEYEIKEYLENELGITNIIQSDKTLLSGKEIDIYMPDKKLAIEFNGTYWHSSIYKDRIYHQQKSLACEEKGVRLIHIFEYEWLDEDKQKKIKAYLKDILSGSEKVIYGRETEAGYITIPQAKDFCEKYHLQGYVSSIINIGLFHNQELIGVMTFGFPRFNREYHFEILRLCYKSGITVIGGTQKMFKNFQENYNPESVISYCNIAKFDGQTYLNLGFTQINISSPNYVWVNTSENDVLSRYKTQKGELVAKNWGTYDQTEDEIMENHGYLKIYDAGNKVFTYNIK